MSHLYEVLARRVDKWRADGYPAADFPAIGEIFEWASDPDMVGPSDIPTRKLVEEVLVTHPLPAAGN